MKKKIKYALVLSGGGFNGAFQLGAINYINDNWKSITGLSGKMNFDLIAGVSVGAINGSMLALNKLGLLNDLWLNKIAKNGAGEIYTSDFIDVNSKSDDLKMKLNLEAIRQKFIPKFKIKLSVFKKLAMIFSKKKRKEIILDILKDLSNSLKKSFPKFKALASNLPLKKKLQEYLNKDAIKNTDFICGFVSLDDGQYRSVHHSEFVTNDDFVNGVLSSSCIPIVWEPVDSIAVNGKDKNDVIRNLIDGGVSNVSPLGDVVRKINEDQEDCEYKIFIINCHSGYNIPEDYTNKNIAQIATRSLYEIAFTEIFNNDVKHFLKINDLIKQAQAWDQDIVLFDSGVKQLKAFDAVVIQPHKDMDLGNGLVANEKLINSRVEHGKLMAEEKLLKGG